MAIEKVLVVDDEPILRNFLEDTLKRQNKIVVKASDGQQAIKYLKSQSFDLVITDMKMPQITGLDVLKFAKKCDKSLLVILVTAHGSIENAVEAMQIGAFHYLIKPFSYEAIEAVLEKAEQHFSLIQENNFLKEEITKQLNNQNIIAEDPVMKQIVKKAVKVAKSDASVFISGESGTGKEVIARAIHRLSKRKNAPFIPVNCAAIPDTLIESEFFGHEKGAFTGAMQKRIGRFERAHLGTLFLDEVTETPISIQPKLLRAIQEQEFERVGSNSTIKVNVRFIAATNRDMEEAINTKVFREDLYYRLNVVPIHLLPLRERKKDIYPLAKYFIHKHCAQHGREIKNLSDEAKMKLMEYHWPGNVRELANVIERAVVLDEEKMIGSELLFLKTKEKEIIDAQLHGEKTLRELEKEWILKTLLQVHQNRTKAAKILGISVRTLRNKLKEYSKSSA